MNIFILEAIYKNRDIINPIDEVIHTENKAINRLDLNTLVFENLSCVKELEALENAINRIMSSKIKNAVRVLNLNTELRQVVYESSYLNKHNKYPMIKIQEVDDSAMCISRKKKGRVFIFYNEDGSKI